MKLLLTVASISLLMSLDTQAADEEKTNTTNQSPSKPLAQPATTIAKQYPEQQTQWIDNTNRQALLIRFANTIDITYGRILLVSESGSAPESSGFNKGLIDQLPRLGWHFNYLFINDLKWFESTDSYDQNLPRFINQSIAQSNNEAADEFFLIVKGNIIETVINSLAKEAPTLNGLVLVEPNFTDLESMDAVTTLSKLSIPLHIVHHKNLNNSERAWLKQLKDASSEVRFTEVIPSQLNSQSETRFFVHRLHGWFKKLALKDPQ